MIELIERSTRLIGEFQRNPPRCKICRSEVSPFDVVDFNKSCTGEIYPQGLLGIPVFYYSCNACGFVFTNFFDTFAEEDWKHHIYNKHYIDVDPDYARRRPAVNALEISSVLFGEKGIIGLDYGGGNGLTAELINDAGIDYDCFDPFGAKKISEQRFGNYNFCSAFEVFEHTPDPAASLQEILKICSKDKLLILIGTGISDDNIGSRTRLQWEYAAPRNGHISLFSKKSLIKLGEAFGLGYSSVSPGTHILYKGTARKHVYTLLLKGKLIKKLRLALKKVTLRRGELPG